MQNHTTFICSLLLISLIASQCCNQALIGLYSLKEILIHQFIQLKRTQCLTLNLNIRYLKFWLKTVVVTIMPNSKEYRLKNKDKIRA
jgi:hypothetical protein